MSNRLMLINGRRKRGLDFLADLWSGRLSQTIAQILEMTVITRREIKIMTQNEQKIINAASVISEAADTLSTEIQGLKQQLADAKGQPVEDLTDEFASLDAALDKLKNVDLAPAQSPGVMASQETGDVSSGTQVPMTSPGEPEAPGTQVLSNAVEGQSSSPTDASSSSDEPMPSGTGTGTGSNVPPDSPANVIGQESGQSVPADTEPGPVDDGGTTPESTDDGDGVFD